MARVNDSPGRGMATALGLLGLLAATPAVGYERIQTHGRRVWIGPGDVMTLTDPERDRVALFDASGERPRKLGEFGEQGRVPGELLGPHGAVVTPWGELVVADSFNHRIQSFDAGAVRERLRPALLRVFAEAGGYVSGLDAPMALALRAGTDRVLVADTRNGRVVEFGRDGRLTGLVFGRRGAAQGELGWPSALAFDADGRTLFVAEEWNARVSAFDAQTGAFLFAAGQSAGGEPGPGIPAGLARVGDDLLVADQAGRRIVRLRIERGDGGRARGLRAKGSWGRAGAGPGQFQYPQSIAADSRGRVYVCDRLDGRCQIFTGEGRFIDAFGEEWQPPEWTAPARPAAANTTGWHEVRSAGGFALRVRADPDPIPLNAPFALVLERPDDPTAETETLRVGAVMPEHRHGMNTQARLLRVDARRYRAAGLILHMAGHWEFHFDRLHDGVWERAQWDVLLESAPAGDIALTAEEVRLLQRHSPLPRLPLDETNKVADDPAAARLGHALFYDARLSPGSRFACASCHDPEKSWTDGRSLSRGTGQGSRNTLSLWNVGYNRWFFWDGRADSLWSQALKPMESPIEMGGSRLAVAWLVSSDAALRAAYTALFGAPPDAAARRYPRSGGPSAADAAQRAAWERLPAEDRAAVNQVFVDVGKAIAAFERRLVSRRAPFDVFVEGLREGDLAKQAALPDAARRGARIFVGRGRCSVCHAGPLFTDGEFHDIGVPPNEAVVLPDIGRLAGIEALLADELGASGPWSDDRGGPRAALVRHLAPRPEVAGQMKTPSLRNVALSGPYMHEGQLATLRDVLRYYSTLEGRRGLPAQRERILVPLQLGEQDVDDLVAFLESLTDTAIEPSLLRPPEGPGKS